MPLAVAGCMLWQHAQHAVMKRFTKDIYDAVIRYKHIEESFLA